MDITIKIIPHSSQRYNTVGDWQVDPTGNVLITVSAMSDWKKELLVAFHEIVEYLLCKDRNIPQEFVDKFDTEYEAARSEWDKESEPGDAAGAPYRKEHFFATTVERLLATELNVDWKAYEEAIMAL